MEQTENSGEETKNALAMASYLGPLCFASLLTREKNDFVRFHTKQGIALFATEIVLWTAFWILSKAAVWFSWSAFWSLPISLLQRFVYLFIGFLIYTGVVNTLDDQEKKLPLIGKFAGRVQAV